LGDDGVIKCTFHDCTLEEAAETFEKTIRAAELLGDFSGEREICRLEIGTLVVASCRVAALGRLRKLMPGPIAVSEEAVGSRAASWGFSVCFGDFGGPQTRERSRLDVEPYREDLDKYSVRASITIGHRKGVRLGSLLERLRRMTLGILTSLGEELTG